MYLGNITIGERSRVGAGSVVLRDVPPDSTVVGVPAHIIYREGKRVLITDPHDVKDPLSDALIALSEKVQRLECRIKQIDGELQQQVPEMDAARNSDDRRSGTRRVPHGTIRARRLRQHGRRNLEGRSASLVYSVPASRSVR